MLRPILVSHEQSLSQMRNDLMIGHLENFAARRHVRSANTGLLYNSSYNEKEKRLSALRIERPLCNEDLQSGLFLRLVFGQDSSFIG
jgi:hypothetical protein